jgi:hypothetical protein
MMSFPGRHRAAFRLLSAFLVVSLTVGWLAPCLVQARTPVNPNGIGHELSERIFKGFERVSRAVIARADRADNLDLTLKSLFKDSWDRVFLNVEGRARVNLARLPETARKKLLGAKGYHLASNGCIAVDFMLRDVKTVAADEAELLFEFDVVLLLHPFLRELTKSAVSTLGVLTMDLVAGRVIECLEKLDTENLGEAVAAGVKVATSTVMKDAGEQTYEHVHQFQGVSKVLEQGVSPMSIAYSVGLATLKGAARSGMKYTGLTLGGAVGAALVPGTGAAIGTVIGAIAFVLIGQVVIGYVTTDVPAKYRMWRIRRAHERGDLEGKAAVVGKLLETIGEEAERQKYETFDLVVGALTGLKQKGQDLAPYQELVKGVLEKLQFYVLQEQDWNASRKYYQLKQVLGDTP